MRAHGVDADAHVLGDAGQGVALCDQAGGAELRIGQPVDHAGAREAARDGSTCIERDIGGAVLGREVHGSDAAFVGFAENDRIAKTAAGFAGEAVKLEEPVILTRGRDGVLQGLVPIGAPRAQPACGDGQKRVCLQPCSASALCHVTCPA